MRILFLTPRYPDAKSKQMVFIQEQINAMGRKHVCEVISSKIDYDSFGILSYTLNEVSDEKSIEHQLRIKRSIGFTNQLNYFVVSVFVSLRIARKFKPDIIHGNIGYPGAFWSMLTGWFLRKPFVLTEHTFIYNNFRTWMHKKLTLAGLSKAAAIITVSNAAANEIRKYVKTPVKVVPNILRAEMFSVVPFPEGTTAIGFMGNLSSSTHVKGLDVLLRTLSKVKFDFKLLIGGEGQKMDEYKELATSLGIIDKCVFFGFFPYDQGNLFMHKLHFFVCTSIHESFGIALTEAIASGVPVVSFNNGGPADFINESNGVLVEHKNEDKLLEVLEWMNKNYMSFDRQKMRSSVIKKFSIETFIKNMELVYQEILNIPLRSNSR